MKGGLSVVSAVTLALVASACASAPRSTSEMAQEDRDRRMCSVRVENGTGMPLQLRYWVSSGFRGSLGETEPSQSVSFGIDCNTSEVSASGVGPYELGGSPWFRKVARIDNQSRETVIKLTVADRQR